MRINSCPPTEDITQMNRIINNPCEKALKELEDNSVDLIVTDPPYGYSFMGKDWDKAVPSVEVWKECLRVLKPGAFAFIMSAPRQDVLSQMIVRIGEAGFDTCYTSMYHTYASGFPKAINIHKKLTKDAEAGKHRLQELFRASLHQASSDGKNIIRAPLSALLEAVEQGAQYEVFAYAGGQSEGAQVSEGRAEHSLEGGTDIPQAQGKLCVCEICSLPVRLRINGEEGWLCDGAPTGSGEVTWTVIDQTGMRTSFQSRPVGQPTGKLEAICEQCRAQTVGALDGAFGGFNPKPAVEVVIVAMKPLSERTYVDQALKNGKGITWLDDCRIGTEQITTVMTNNRFKVSGSGVAQPQYGNDKSTHAHTGRFPANLLISNNILDTIPCTCTQEDTTQTAQEDLNSDELGTKDYQRPTETSSRMESHAQKKRERKSQTLSKESGNLPNTEKPSQKPDSLFTTSEDASQSEAIIATEHMDDGCEPSENEMEINASGAKQPRTSTLTTSSHSPDSPNYDMKSATGAYCALNATGRPRPTESNQQYSRFFSLDAWAKTLPFLIVPKASKSEKNGGLGDGSGSWRCTCGQIQKGHDSSNCPKKQGNHHPTVKPLKLMSYLITLGSREGDVVLDPFLGSGTTACAAKALGRKYIGIEMSREYAEIARARVLHTEAPQSRLLPAE